MIRLRADVDIVSDAKIASRELNQRSLEARSVRSFQGRRVQERENASTEGYTGYPAANGVSECNS